MLNQKISLLTVSVLITAMSLSGCSTAQAENTAPITGKSVSSIPEDTLPEKTKAEEPASSGEKSLNIVCTIFPEYDWVREILGSHAENDTVTYLLDNGVDLHSYQPTASDMAKIAQCDLFIYVGGESDGWTEDALAEAVNPDMQVINLMEVMGDSAKPEELKEGMQGEEEEEHGEEEEEEEEYDEHVWLSLKNAKLLCAEITEKLCILDDASSEDYRNNLSAYTGQLDKLDSDFQALADSASVKTLIFGDRFPFRYFTDDYGLDYYAAFIGCSAETEASFETIIFLADKVNALGVPTVFTIENSDQKIAKTIIENTSDKNQNIAVLNSIQSVTSEQIADGINYLSLMQENYDVLRNALN